MAENNSALLNCSDAALLTLPPQKPIGIKNVFKLCQDCSTEQFVNHPELGATTEKTLLLIAIPFISDGGGTLSKVLPDDIRGQVELYESRSSTKGPRPYRDLLVKTSTLNWEQK